MESSSRASSAGCVSTQEVATGKGDGGGLERVRRGVRLVEERVDGGFEAQWLHWFGDAGEFSGRALR